MTSPESVDMLFDEFIDARQRGERPDVVAFLDRAGGDRELLGRMIDAYLVAAPVVPPDEATIVLMTARVAGRTPLAELRERRHLSVATVVESLREALALREQLTGRLREAYEDLERDWLDPRGVQPPVWQALTSILGVDVRKLVSIETQPRVAGVLMRREPGEQVTMARAARRSRDEIDELFRASPSE